jgi:hypothetical protein
MERHGKAIHGLRISSLGSGKLLVERELQRVAVAVCLALLLPDRTTTIRPCRHGSNRPHPGQRRDQSSRNEASSHQQAHCPHLPTQPTSTHSVWAAPQKLQEGWGGERGAGTFGAVVRTCNFGQLHLFLWHVPGPAMSMSKRHPLFWSAAAYLVASRVRSSLSAPSLRFTAHHASCIWTACEHERWLQPRLTTVVCSTRPLRRRFLCSTRWPGPSRCATCAVSSTRISIAMARWVG